MTIQSINDASVAVYLTPADLRVYHVTPAGLTPELARKVTQSACQRAGIVLEGSIEIEVFPESCGVLIFARVQPNGPTWFLFDGIEDVLSAALALRHAPPESALWWCEGKYWLSLPETDPGAEGICAQFGSSQLPDPLRAQYLNENGRLIFQKKALRQLYRQFCSLHF